MAIPTYKEQVQLNKDLLQYFSKNIKQGSYMCGIFGYLGEGCATKIVFNGLKNLEYRGYDSWGVAVVKDQAIRLEKHVGAIGEAKLKLSGGRVAVGHTRWATNGGVTEKNAHPTGTRQSPGRRCCRSH